MKILVLYHYYRPDDVVSSVQFTDLAEGLVDRGHAVEVWPSNRDCHHPEKKYSTHPEVINGVTVRRVWRPAFRQHSFFGRILNSIWMQKLWWFRLFFTPAYQPDVIITGTDPLFSVAVVPFLKWIRPQAKIAHWCFDLYPEAAAADGVVGEKSFLVRMLQWFLKPDYRACDLVADLGPCMAERLKRYPVKKEITLTPWALEEPAKPMAFDQAERKDLFGKASLGLLYSGSFGRAHNYTLTLALVRQLGKKVILAYSARGSRLDELKKAMTPEDNNVRFVDFAPPDRLRYRLSAPDVHIVSLRPEWTGTVVPSKFFGALAAGRPVLFEGDESSSIAQWIRKYKVGWVLSFDAGSYSESAGATTAFRIGARGRPAALDRVAKDLTAFAKDQKRKIKMFKHCHRVYIKYFSKKTMIDQWNRELVELK
jgi:glycosyltransferase involved in cell wall biosynthesis